MDLLLGNTSARCDLPATQLASSKMSGIWMMAAGPCLGQCPFRVLSGCRAEGSDVRSHSSAQAELEAVQQAMCDTRARSCINDGIFSLWTSMYRACNGRPESRYVAIRGMSADATLCPMQRKCTLASQAILMVIIWPASLLLGLIDMVQHTILEEPPDYRARKSSGGGTSMIDTNAMLG